MNGDDAIVRRAWDVARASGVPQLAIGGRALGAEECADALAAFAAAPRTEERCAFARDGAALAASGACAAIETEGARRLGDAAALLREQALRTHAAPDAAVRWLGGFAFAPEAPRADGVWRGFASCRFVLPRAVLLREGDCARLAWASRVQPNDALAAALDAHGAARTRAEALASTGGSARHADATRGARAGAGTATLANDPDETRAAAPYRLLRPARGYRQRVAAALDAIAKGDAQKLVVARALELRDVRAPVETTLRALAAAHPACLTFALAPAGADGATFFGATPELLVRLARGEIAAQALAGSARRGATLDRDSRERCALHGSAKERAEHALVVDAMRDALAPLCGALSAPAPPRTLALGDLQHLETPVRARLAGGVNATALDLAARLHPSPAVGGTRRDAALAWLAANESLERGWYAGAVGWLDAAGDGELHVALRCALQRGASARLFAGAGVVAGSRPAAEQRETRLKLRAVLRALAEMPRARG